MMSPVPPAPSPTKDGSLFKGISVESRSSRRMSALPPRTTALGRSSTVNRGSSGNVPSLVNPSASVEAHALTFPSNDDEHARRRRRRHSEHPTNAPPKRESASVLATRLQPTEKRSKATDVDMAPGLSGQSAPRRPQRHPTLHLHDLDDALLAKPVRSRRWAETPGAASVAAWVAEQQVQSQFQFAPMPPTPTTPALKVQTGLLSKVKKLVKK
jgi:hypothetical protein